MHYISTRGQSPALLASQAITRGLAPDGGLYVPESWPSAGQLLQSESASEFESELGFPDLAGEILLPFFAEDALLGHLPNLCRQAFDFPLVLKQLTDDTSLL